MGNGAKPKKAFRDAFEGETGQVDDERRRTLVDRIERCLALAYGQPRPFAERVLDDAARIINDHCFPAWGIEVRLKYLGQGSPLAPYIAADLRRRHQASHKAAWAPPLSAEQAKLVTDHLQLVRKYAGSIARGNQVLFSELEELGLRQESVRKYDPSRRVKFGAFARHRLRGAMLDHAVLKSKPDAGCWGYQRNKHCLAAAVTWPGGAHTSRRCALSGSHDGNRACQHPGKRQHQSRAAIPEIWRCS